MERAPSGFCLSFEPRRGRRRRTSGRGQATSTGLELRLRSMFEPPINVFTHMRATSRRRPVRSSPRPRPPGWNGPPLGFPPSFAPRRPGAGRRTSRAGTGHRARTWNYTLNITSADPPIGSSLITCDLASHRPTGKRAERSIWRLLDHESGSPGNACWPARVRRSASTSVAASSAPASHPRSWHCDHAGSAGRVSARRRNQSSRRGRRRCPGQARRRS